MEPDEVRELYDAEYAKAYDERFLVAEPWVEAAEFEIEILSEILDHDDAKWLDLGCGTGWVLSKFPGVPRAGLDMSPAMLAEARLENPDALFLREGDFREDVPEWHDEWSVLSCMWAAFSYLRSMAEIDQLVENMVRWVRPGGTVFIPVLDLADLRGVHVPYEASPSPLVGQIAITSVTWTWDEPSSGRRHEHLLAPHCEHFVRLLEPHFTAIEVRSYPGDTWRRAVVATGRRPRGTRGRAVVSIPAPPDAPDHTAADLGSLHAAVHETSSAVHDEIRATRSQLDALSAALFPPPDPDRYDTLGVTHDQVGALRGDVAELHGLVASLARAEPTPAPPSRRLPGVSTKAIAAELARRLNPIRRLRSGRARLGSTDS